MKNSELICYTSKERMRLLTELERQRLYCLQIDMAKNQCPVCEHPSNMVEAAGLDIDDFPADNTSGLSFECPSCKAPLTQIVPFFPHGNGGWFWRASSTWLLEKLRLAKEAEIKKGGA